MRWRAIATVAVVVLTLNACDESTPSSPSVANLGGTWTGTSSYPNAPFQMSLTQAGDSLRGEYADRLDRSLSLTGTYTRPAIAIVVDFGDAKLNFNGTVVDARTITGTMYTSALGNTPYSFTMTR